MQKYLSIPLTDLCGLLLLFRIADLGKRSILSNSFQMTRDRGFCPVNVGVITRQLLTLQP